MKGFFSFLMLLGRWALSALFLYGGIMKCMHFGDAVQAFQQSTGLSQTAATWSQILTTIAQLLFGFGLAIGWQVRLSALVLAAFTLYNTIVQYSFWEVAGPDKMDVVTNFMKGIGITGGLLNLLGSGSGCCALDALSKKGSESSPS